MDNHVLLPLAIMLTVAKLGGELCERWLKQPAVLGEIIGGVLVGQSVAKWVNGGSPILEQIAMIGAVLLLFEVGLESDLDELFRLGLAALWVAVLGVLLPFVFGYLIAHALGQPTLQAIFIGAALTATSIGIAARVFSDMEMLQTAEAKMVLGAAVIDDVIGLIILATVTGLAKTQTVSWTEIGKVAGLSILFLVGAIVVGRKLTPYLLHWVQKMQIRAALPSVAVVFCLVLATLAEAVQLAPIIGAFAAGLVLAKAEHKVHFEAKVKSIADIFVPIFFVLTGAKMQIAVFNPMTSVGRGTLLLGTCLALMVVVSKILVGASLPLRKVQRWMVGVGTIPRGEVSLLFASIGLSSRVLGASQYAAILFVVIFTTFSTPPLLKWMISQGRPKGGENPASLPEPPM